MSTRRLAPLLLALGLVAGGHVGASATPEPTSVTVSPVPPCTFASTDGGEWPIYGRDLSNSRDQSGEDAIGPEQAPALRPAWTFSSQDAGGTGDFTGTPVAAGGCVFVGSNMGWIYAIDADTGELEWKKRLPRGGTINSSLAVHGDRVYGFVSRVGRPYVVAMDRSTGAIEWETTVDTQDGADAFASPVVWKGLVMIGVSGDAAQHGKQRERAGFHGSFVLLDEATGRLVKKIWTIPRSDWKEGYAGATVTTTPAIDPRTGHAYVGTSSPYMPQLEHEHADAMLKIDLDRSRKTFGQIVGSYKGDTLDDVVPGYSSLPCEPLPGPEVPAIVPAGRGVGACAETDVDFAASPSLFKVEGRKLVGSSQKSGYFHTADARSMKGVWRTRFGPPQSFGGVSAAVADGHIVSAAAPGYAYALSTGTGQLGWVSPIADGAHYGHAMASANGVAYTVDLRGFLDAYDAASGVPLLHWPMAAGTGGPASSFGGVSVAYHTVFAAVGIQSTGLDVTGSMDGHVVAFR